MSEQNGGSAASQHKRDGTARWQEQIGATVRVWIRLPYTWISLLLMFLGVVLVAVIDERGNASVDFASYCL